MQIDMLKIDWNQAVTLTQKLVSVNSFELKGKIELIHYLSDKIKKESPKAQVSDYDMDTDAPYMVASIKVPNPKFTLLLQGHLDTVSPEGMEHPFSGTIDENGVLWGRGASDMKSGCAAIFTDFIEASKLNNLKGDIYLAYSTDEEYNAAEMGKALKSGHIPHCDLAVIAEPTDDTVYIAHKGNAWLQVEFLGRSAHASRPQTGINAIYMANEFITELKEYLKTAYIGKEDSICGSPSMNLGTIHAGFQPNVVPPNCTIMIDRRYLPDESIDTCISEINALLDKCKEKNPDFKSKVSVIVNCLPMRFPIKSPLLGTVINAINKTHSVPVKTGAMSGWGEGGFIQNFNIPSLYYGPGRGHTSHTPNECADVSNIIQMTENIFSIILDTCF